VHKKTVLSSILIFVLGISLGAYVVYALPGSTFYISSGLYPEATYTIWRESSNYYAKTCFGELPSWGIGSTNATYVLKSLASVLAVGDTVQIKAGIYELDHAWDLSGKYGFKISGDYRGRFEDNATGTVLKLKDGVKDHIITKVETAPAKIHPCTIEYLHLCGNSLTNATGYDGIHLEQCKRFIIQYCQFTYIGRASISITQSCEAWTVENNEITGSYYGLYLRNGLGGRIHNNMIGTATHGIYIYDHSWGNQITTNLIWNSYTAGIQLIGNWVSEQQILGNQLYDGSGHGISLRINSSNNIINDNECMRNSYSGISLSGTSGYNSSWNIIEGNLCFDNGHWGIKEESGYVDRNLFLGNTCIDNTLGGIWVNGSNTQVNHCWNGSTWIS